MEITKPIRLIELFCGIGSQAMSLRDLGADFEHYRAVDFDTFAIQGYNLIHDKDFQLTDIRDLKGSDLGITDKEHYFYIMTYSFPCTDLSVAGEQKGMSKADWEQGNSTRSGMLWEVERLLKECDELPDVILMENVPQVHGEKNFEDFKLWLSFLESKGYVNYWEDLDASDYGTAQHRERCFMVSVMGNYNYKFPTPMELIRDMESYLDIEVDERYYINSEKARKLIIKLMNEGTLPVEGAL